MMKRILFLLFLLVLSCKKSPHVSRDEIRKLTGVQVEKIAFQKKYQLDDSPSFEDVTLLEAEQKTRLAVFTPTEKGYILLRQYTWPTQLTDAKLFFISIGNKKSHIAVSHGSGEKILDIFDTKDFMQEFTPRTADTAAVKTTKTEDKPLDEILVLGKTNYRFNGIAWVPWPGGDMFPYLETFSVAEEKSLIEIVNRGQPATRVVVTLAFSEVSAADLAQKLRLVKNIPTVSMAPPAPGRAAYPVIEVRKDNWPHNGRLKLPLFMKDIRHLRMRATYTLRGSTLAWPAATATGPGFVKDNQGYLYVEK